MPPPSNNTYNFALPDKQITFSKRKRVAFIIPFRSHLEVGDCHSVAPPSLSVRRMKCRSPRTDLCLPAPASPAPYLFPRNGRHSEIRIIINQRSQQLFMRQLKRSQWRVLLSDTDSRWHDK
ncbi:hypothetical protein F2P81_011720 [Scophthalmus maximus]|uniref:Uncharacterized protein n=1 Tax=Scophthalmus maximus TaxID=52904 RepID=A0A6A4SWE2_SCOMX|nr:hypothetical protein F2P81_011720 [Scophthalmus maximus]